ncbi:methionyl-tRNA formyltransferase [Geosmithia morbida]|uniref:Methionyl-tRNA formyltransferase n=1 Tax=Geosmithia morbida TaxID=1094350 RepID=A0A9P4Z045_9HYPO|nr:methionyl-tRNA formyltransferase [Geosmithia morbida]KAF4125712.1 methionyl-tRNA formyltransferase [Geosmithia morbida]
MTEDVDDDDGDEDLVKEEGSGYEEEEEERVEASPEAVKVTERSRREVLADSIDESESEPEPEPEPEPEQEPATPSGESDSEGGGGSVNRQSKRRKLSITPLPAFDSSPQPQDDNSSSDLDDGAGAPQHQPTFHEPPRFFRQNDEGYGGDRDGGDITLASPPRRGYVRGGMAAELQGWLHEVKGVEGEGGNLASTTTTTTTPRVTVNMLVPRTRPAFALGGRVTTTRPWSRCTYMTTSGKRSDPLRILFCGSDTFSTEALHALYEEHRFNPELVQSIDVVMPKGINLIVAVSFGLFVPPRLLKQAKYGGLNVHPSFLPDLRGPAPIHHAVLRGDDYVGVSLQTLDAAHFDHGVILSQTERPGLRATRHWTLNLLTRKLAIEGSELLVEGLRQGLHVPPYSNAAAVADNDDGADKVPGQRQQQRQQQERQGLRHAPKIRTSDTEIRWDAWTADDWARRLQMKQAIWTKGQSQGTQGPSSRRLIIHDSRLVPEEEGRDEKPAAVAVRPFIVEWHQDAAPVKAKD